MGPPDWDYNGDKSLGFPFSSAQVSDVTEGLDSVLPCADGTYLFEQILCVWDINIS